MAHGALVRARLCEFAQRRGRTERTMETLKEAQFYERMADGHVRCTLCPHECKIGLDKRGICGVRFNENGTLVTLVYGRVVARHLDPIEKKPLFHFQPGSTSYSIATVGCNLRCTFCQNYEISQMPKGGKAVAGT